MNDLFRFLVMRPAQAIASQEVDSLDASSLLEQVADSIPDARTKALGLAQQYVLSDQVVRDATTLHFLKPLPV